MSNNVVYANFNTKKKLVVHPDGRVLGTVSMPNPEESLPDRLARIRASLEKINRLMAELKRISKQEQSK